MDVVLLCPAGFEQVVARVAATELQAFRASVVGGGYVRAITASSATELRAFPCATNAFSVVLDVRRSRLDAELEAIARALPAAPRVPGAPSRSTFRLRIHDDGTFASTSSPIATRVEAAVAAWSGWTASRAAARVEVWVIRRAEQRRVVLAIKLTKGNQAAARGTLRPEVAAALARVENVARRRVIDPFAGSGAIAIACVDAGAAHVWANDVTTSPRLPKGVGRDRLTTTRNDFRMLDVADASIDVVVTDPPWGHFEQPAGGVNALYADIGATTSRWLRDDGALVALTAADDDAVAAMLDAGRFDAIDRLPVLISGRKATVVHARRR